MNDVTSRLCCPVPPLSYICLKSSTSNFYSARMVTSTRRAGHHKVTLRRVCKTIFAAQNKNKQKKITYYECEFVALIIQPVMRMSLIFICGLPHSTELFHIISQTSPLSKGKLLNIKWVFIFPVWNISNSKKKWAGYDQKSVLFFVQGTCYTCDIVSMKLEFSWQIFKKTI